MLKYSWEDNFIQKNQVQLNCFFGLISQNFWKFMSENDLTQT